MRLRGGAQAADPGSAACGEVVLVHVRGVEDRLRGEQSQLAQEPQGLFGLTGLPGPAPRVELAQHALEHDELELGRLVPGPRRLAALVEAPLDHAPIGERDLARDDVVVAYGV